MENRLEQAICQKIMISFAGASPPAGLLESLRHRPIAGVTLFRHLNVQNPGQVRELTSDIQRTAREAGFPPLLIAADQEGGQLMAIGEGVTLFPGNMALGATGSEELAQRVGYAMGCELAAMGINLNYAPVCDVNLNPLNPAVGTRSFGEDTSLVTRLSSAMIKGLQAAGVAATAKHFPGHGDSASDPHFAAPVNPSDEILWRLRELPPYVAAIRSGVELVMSSHVALPALNQGLELPTTLSPALLRGILRKELSFPGLIVSDAMDMEAIRAGGDLAIDAVAAAAAGIDLILLTHEPGNEKIVYQAIRHAAHRALLSSEDLFASADRVLDLKRRLSSVEQPSLEIVGCPDHQALAQEVATRSVTFVRDFAGLLPLRLPSISRLAVIVPSAVDLTPADTSSYVAPSLAQAIREFHPNVDEFIVPINPLETEVAALCEHIEKYDLIIIGTINARSHAGQAALLEAILSSKTPVIAVALRMPDDLLVYPAAQVYLCTYSILPASMQALAKGLFGHSPFQGTLPLSVFGESAQMTRIS